MAQAGRLYPRATFQDFRASLPQFAENQFMPRKIFVQFSNFLSGSLTDKWEGITAISDVCTRTDNGVMWKIPHPTVTTDDPHYRWWLDLRVNTPSDVFGQSFAIYADYWEQGIRWGRSNRYSPGPPFYVWPLSPPYPLFSSGTWLDQIDPAKFVGSNGFPYTNVRPATWAEQPEFRPYVTRP